MGISLGGLASYLSPALSVATSAAGAKAIADQQNRQQQQQLALQLAVMNRQAEHEAAWERLQLLLGGKAQSQTDLNRINAGQEPGVAPSAGASSPPPFSTRPLTGLTVGSGGLPGGGEPPSPPPTPVDTFPRGTSPAPPDTGAAPPAAARAVPSRLPNEPLATYNLRVRAALALPKTPAAGPAPQKFVDASGASIWVKPGDPVPAGAKPWAPPVAPDKTLETVADPNAPEGPGIRVPRSQAIGASLPSKPKAENAMNLAATARLNAAVSEMNNADGWMRTYEKGLVDKTVDISGLSQFIGRVGNTFTHDDPVSQGLSSAALATLDRVNPDLARYIRRGLSFAEGESMISQRPSDFRTRMASFLSTAASGASPEMVQDIQSRRSSILGPLNTVVGPSGPTKSGGGRGSAPPSGAAPKTVTVNGKTYVVPD